MSSRRQIGGIGFVIWVTVQGASAAPVTNTKQIGDLALHYSTDFRLVASLDDGPTTYIPLCRTPFDACLIYVGTRFTRPNFSGASIQVHLRTGATRETCVLGTPKEGEGAVVRHERGDYVTSVVLEYDAGMSGLSHYANGELYRLLAQDRCYEIETRWTYHTVQERPSSAFSQKDAREIAAILRTVVESTTLRNRQVQW